jgi:carboxyl-terminal processing protease
MSNNNSRFNIIIPSFVAILLAAGILIGISLPKKNDVSHYTITRQNSDKLANIMNIIESSYVDSVDRTYLTETAINSILEKLDPHSIYMPASELAKANEPLQGNFDGIGISFNMLTDTVLVISTISGGPSEKVGIQAGDKIILVNDSLIAGIGMPDDDVMGLLKGPKGSKVNVKILRKGQNELLSFDIVRDRIPINSVDVAYMVNENTGYIKIANFALTTYHEFKTSLDELEAEGMSKLIIDLRNNSGGIMEASIQIANEFLKEGELIVFTMGRSQPRSEARATGDGTFGEGDLVILIDEWTASASEILAGAIQDNDRGTIIGRRSFGKGLVQEPISFPDGSGMRLTIARYYTPTGRSIQKPYENGVEEYYSDLETRYFNGEFEVADSIHFPDSLKFTTPGGNVVYGGGGIMPDIFIPLDTVGVTPYLIDVRPYIYEYAMMFTENNREEMSQYDDVADLEEYLDNQDLVNSFTTYIDEKYQIKRNRKELMVSESIIENQLKAYIARNIIDNKGFYPIWNQNDVTIQYAVDYLNKEEE